MPRKIVQNQTQFVPNPRPLEGCPVCWTQKKPSGEDAKGWITSLPVYLVDGKKQTLICYTAKCVECGYIAHYGLQQGVYKLNGRVPDFAVANWPEIRRNRINAEKFLYKVLRSGVGPAYVQLSEVQYGQ